MWSKDRYEQLNYPRPTCWAHSPDTQLLLLLQQDAPVPTPAAAPAAAAAAARGGGGRGDIDDSLQDGDIALAAPGRR
jgi:hypothetical protein